MPSLAPELVLQILEAAYAPSSSDPHPDTFTLSNAALVCSLWRPLAQEVLFRNVVLARTPGSRVPAARAAPGILLAASGPSHALRDTNLAAACRSSRAARLQALTTAATPAIPTPYSQRATQSFLNALQIDLPSPSDRALGLSSLVRSVHLFVSQPDPAAACGCGGNVHGAGEICPNPCSVASPLSTGALTERHLAVLLGRLPSLRTAHIVLDCVNSFSPLVIDALRASSNVSTLGIYVLKRPLSTTSFNVNNAIGARAPLAPQSALAEGSSDTAVFQLVHALAPNLDTLILDGELPRDPPANVPTRLVERRPSPAGLDWGDHVATEPAPDCSLRELIWRGKLPPSPALLAWLLSAKAQGVPPVRRRSRLQVLELSYLPPPNALSDLLREHVPTLRSLRLHYFDAAHVDVVRELLGHDIPSAPRKQGSLYPQTKLHELVLHRRCAVAPELLLAIQAQHVAVTQPCGKTLQVLEDAGRCGFKHVTVVGGDRRANEQVRLACEADGVTFESVRALAPVF